MTLSPAFDSWKRKAADADILDVAISKCGAVLKKAGGREYIGPCPSCGGEDRFGVNVAKGVFNCRGSTGGDVIAMVMHVHGCDFLGACEIITGEPPPDGAPSQRPAESADDIARRERERAERERDRADEDSVFREREREKVYEMWRRGAPIAGTAVEAYLRLRGIPELPAELRLRCISQMPYYASNKGDAEVIHRGPAMLAPIVGAASLKGEDRFSGLHLTYVDLAQPKGKLTIPDPDKPGKLRDAKKVRGSQAGGHIALVDVPAPRRLIIGEGIEKTLAVWFALMRAGRDLAQTSFWTSVNLGNLGGKAATRVRNPFPDRDGKRKQVAGPQADETPAIVIPDSVDDMLLLGDGTSDLHKRFNVACTLARAGVRYGRRSDGSPRTVRVAWSPDDADFDDLLRVAA